jgi:hypothetical protein
MIISSINIRGLGGAVKRNTIKELIRKEKIQFLAVQETKMETISDSFCYGLWGGEDCQWVFLPSIGNSGGLLSIWCNKESEKRDVVDWQCCYLEHLETPKLHSFRKRKGISSGDCCSGEGFVLEVVAFPSG